MGPSWPEIIQSYKTGADLVDDQLNQMADSEINIMNMSKLPSEMDLSLFTSTFHDVYEHTPTIASSVHASVTPHHNTGETLYALLSTHFNNLPLEAKHKILTGYPRLTGITNTLNSTSEQTSRGLYTLPSELQALFSELNAKYEARFGWPFVVPVKDYPVDQILHHMSLRLQNEPDKEFALSCKYINRIAELRVQKWFHLRKVSAKKSFSCTNPSL